MTGNGHPAHFKDQILDGLAEQANVAQFVSFGPETDLPQRFARIRGYPPNYRFDTPIDAVNTLLEQSSKGSVNVRSYHPVEPKGRQFIYGLERRDEVIDTIRSLAATGLYTILNETIDIHDGGVSGVALGGLLEFAPDDTPRCVESPGTLALRQDLAISLLETVYGFRPDLAYPQECRVEFSVHPIRAGFRNGHTIIWEVEQVDTGHLQAPLVWPNRFSRLLGDKAFGLLVAHIIDLPVPRTRVIGRRVAPFQFGQSTQTGERWLRTCPSEQVPGQFSTLRGWTDPYSLLHDEDPDGKMIASVLAQDGVDSKYAGASLPGRGESPMIEGVAGYGDRFMLGVDSPAELPRSVVAAVAAVIERASAQLGSVRMEWAHDGETAWVLQLHLAAHTVSNDALVEGHAEEWYSYDPQTGLAALRPLIQRAISEGAGIVVTGDIGITSHVGDLLRKAGVPARFGEPPRSSPRFNLR